VRVVSLVTRQECERSLAMAPGQCRRLADVLTQTRSMVEHAEAGDWDRVAELERARRDELQQCFARPVAPEHGEIVAEALAVMLHLNEELMGLLATARDTVLEQGVDQSRKRSAIGSYQAVQHSS